MRMGFKEALLVTVSHRGWTFEWVEWTRRREWTRGWELTK